MGQNTQSLECQITPGSKRRPIEMGSHSPMGWRTHCSVQTLSALHWTETCPLQGPPTQMPPSPGRVSPSYLKSPKDLWTHRAPSDMELQGVRPRPSSLICEMGTIQVPGANRAWSQGEDAQPELNTVNYTSLPLGHLMS